MYLSDSPEVMGQSLLPQEQYRAQIGVTQVIWDGGNISAKKRLTGAQAKAEIENNEVILYELNDRVNRIFFGILLQSESLRQNGTHQKDIGDAIASVEAMAANGTANEYDLNLLEVELLNAKQKESEIKSLRSAYMKMLSFLINRRVDENTTLARPESSEELKAEILRPELDYYAAREELLEAQKDSVDAGLDAQNFPIRIRRIREVELRVFARRKILRFGRDKFQLVVRKLLHGAKRKAENFRGQKGGPRPR